MYIDFHTHAFSEKIAEKAMKNLSAVSEMNPCTDGTVGDLCSLLKSRGIDEAVLLPVATKPAQHEIINSWAQSVNNKNGIYAFGSVYPKSEEAVEEVDRIKNRGLYGVKLHPDYQNFTADDESIYPVYEKCSELGLPVVFHAGYDPLSPDFIHGNPEDFVRICENFPDLRVILAHLGGMHRWDIVERLLAGRFENLWLDTAVIAGEIGADIFSRIVKKHGADRILFASDCPWDDPINEIKLIESLDIPNSEKEKIFYKNAHELLGIKR